METQVVFIFICATATAYTIVSFTDAEGFFYHPRRFDAEPSSFIDASSDLEVSSSNTHEITSDSDFFTGESRPYFTFQDYFQEPSYIYAASRAYPRYVDGSYSSASEHKPMTPREFDSYGPPKGFFNDAFEGEVYNAQVAQEAQLREEKEDPKKKVCKIIRKKEMKCEVCNDGYGGFSEHCSLDLHSGKDQKYANSRRKTDSGGDRPKERNAPPQYSDYEEEEQKPYEEEQKPYEEEQKPYEEEQPTQVYEARDHPSRDSGPYDSYYPTSESSHHPEESQYDDYNTDDEPDDRQSVYTDEPDDRQSVYTDESKNEERKKDDDYDYAYDDSENHPHSHPHPHSSDSNRDDDDERGSYNNPNDDYEVVYDASSPGGTLEDGDFSHPRKVDSYDYDYHPRHIKRDTYDYISDYSSDNKGGNKRPANSRPDYVSGRRRPREDKKQRKSKEESMKNYDRFPEDRIYNPYYFGYLNERGDGTVDFGLLDHGHDPEVLTKEEELARREEQEWLEFDDPKSSPNTKVDYRPVDPEENFESLGKMVKEFSQKDRTNCKKKEMRNGMTCYVCPKKARHVEEECIYENDDPSKGVHLMYKEETTY